MGVLGRILGGGLGSVVAPVGSVLEQKEKTKQAQTDAAARIEIAAASWRPWLARVTGWSLILYMTGVVILMFLSWYTSPEPVTVAFLWAQWKTFGSELWSFAALYLGLYVGGRSAQGVAESLAGRAVGSLVDRFDGGVRSKVDIDVGDPIPTPATPVQRLPGIRIGTAAPVAPVAPVVVPVAVPVATTVAPTAPPVEPRPGPWAWDERSMRRLDAVHVDLRRLADAVLAECPYRLGITETHRTAEKQARMKDTGKSWTLNSRHLGPVPVHALDYAIFLPDGPITWDPALYAEVVEIWRSVARRLGIRVTLGADWRVRDYCHVELAWDAYPLKKAA